MVQNAQVARRQVVVSNPLGLHMRDAEKLVTLARAFQSEVRVHGKDIVADCRSILDLLGLAAGCGTMVAVEAQGFDAEDAVTALANLISGHSHESEHQIGEAAY